MKARQKRHFRIRKQISGTAIRPRLAVFRSAKHIYAQVIDDNLHKTVVAESDLKAGKDPKSQRAFEIGKKLAKKALSLKIKKVVFDRGGFLFHGRVKQLADGAKEGGLEF